MRACLGISPDESVVGVVARLDHWSKGHAGALSGPGPGPRPFPLRCLALAAAGGSRKWRPW